MIVNLSLPINSLHGTQLKEKDELLTVGNVLASVLDQTAAIDRRAAYRLAQKCIGDTVDFTTDELADVLAAVQAFPLQSNVIVGQLLLALSGETPDTLPDAQN